MKLRRTMKAQSPKKKEKERYNNNNNNNKEKKKRIPSRQEEGSRAVKGHAARISVRPENIQQEESTSRPYVCSDFQQKCH